MLVARLRSLRLCRLSGVDSSREIVIGKIMTYFMSNYFSFKCFGDAVEEPPNPRRPLRAARCAAVRLQGLARPDQDASALGIRDSPDDAFVRRRGASGVDTAPPSPSP